MTMRTTRTTGRAAPVTDGARQRRAGRALARWVAPGLALVFGIAYLVAGLVGGDAEFGLVGLGVMVAFALLLVLLGRHSETVDGLLSRRDERINALDRTATLFAGAVVLLAVLVMFVVEIARGQDGSPYYQLAGLGGAAYVLALVVLRLIR